MPANQHQLRKMLVIETIGEKLYKTLSLRIKDENLKSIYQQLAVGEAQTAKYIEKEISPHYNNPIIFKEFIPRFAGFVLSLLTVKQLVWILKSTLKRRIYKRWFDIYQANNPNLWKLLLKHEESQHELLKLYILKEGG